MMTHALAATQCNAVLSHWLNISDVVQRQLQAIERTKFEQQQQSNNSSSSSSDAVFRTSMVELYSCSPASAAVLYEQIAKQVADNLMLHALPPLQIEIA